MKKKVMRYRRGLREKILFVGLIPVLFIILLGIFSYREASKAIIKNYEEAMYNTIIKTSEYYNLYLEKADQTLLDIYGDDEISKYYYGYYKNRPSEEKAAYAGIRTYIATRQRQDSSLAAIHLISDYGKSYSTKASISDGQFANLKDCEEGRRISAGAGNQVWFGRHGEVDKLTGMTDKDYALSVGRVLKMSGTGESAFVILDLNRKFFVLSLESMRLPEGSYCAIVTSDGREITSDKMAGAGSFLDKGYYKEMLQAENDTGHAYVEKGDYLYLFSKLGKTGSSVNCIIPKEILMKQANEIKMYTFALVALASIVAIILSVIISIGIGKEMKCINQAAQQAAEGNLAISLKKGRKDEFGTLYGYLGEMFEGMKQLIGRVRSVTGEVYETSDNLTANSNELVNSAEQISQSINNIEKGINEQASNAESCMLKMDELSGYIGSVVENTDMVRRSADRTGEILEKSIKIIDTLSETIQDSNIVTTKAIREMEILGEESIKINTITATINEIADQTNLLALNASIEAARAGEFGKGFSVVADEIRKLAEASIRESAQIHNIVKNVQDKMNTTVTTVANVGETVSQQEKSLEETVSAFIEIRKQMDTLTNNIESITDIVSSMNISKEKTIDAIGSISAVMEETAAASTEVLSAVGNQEKTIDILNEEAERLKEKAGRLRTTVSLFKVSK